MDAGIVKKGVLLLLVSVFLFLRGVNAFPLDMTISSWTKGTIPANHYVNIAAVSTPYGDGSSVNTIGYPGAFEFMYDFFGYYNEVFMVPPSGRVVVKGYFMYNDITPHLDRKHLSVYLLRSDFSGYVTNVTRVLDYAYGHEPGVWYYRYIAISNLTPGEEFRIAFGRADHCDMERELQACWAAIDVTSCHTLKVPDQYSTIQQAIFEASPGDAIQVASGMYYEHITVDKDYLKIIGASSSPTIIDGNMENGPDNAVVYITGKEVFLSHLIIRNCPDSSGIAIHGENATIIESSVMNNSVGILLSANNIQVTKNNIYNNVQGLGMQSVENCLIYYNNFFNNTHNVYQQQFPTGANIWDNGYAGNFWSNYTGTDTNGDGIGDTSHLIDSNNVDNYPLMSPYMCGDVNYDGVINIRDIAFVARRFGCTPTDQLWNPHADINEDAKIDIRDVSITARGFGKKWSYPSL